MSGQTKKSWLFLYGGIIPALGMQAVASVLYFVILTDASAAAAIYFGVKVVMILWPILWFKWYRSSRATLSLLPGRATLRLTIIAGTGLVIGLLLSYWFSSSQLQMYVPLIQNKIAAFHLKEYFLLFSFLLSTVNAVFEEYYWRWFVWRGLSGYTHWRIAALVSSLGFAAHHYIILSQVLSPGLTAICGTGVFLGGLLFCWIYHKTGRLSSSIALHILADVIIMLLLAQLL